MQKAEQSTKLKACFIVNTVCDGFPRCLAKMIVVLCPASVVGIALGAQTYSDPQGRFRIAVPAGQAADRSLPGQQALPAIPMAPVRSPQGDFAIAIPKGWSLQHPPQGDFSLIITPAGKTTPVICILVVRVSDLRYLARLQAYLSGLPSRSGMCRLRAPSPPCRRSSATPAGNGALKKLLPGVSSPIDATRSPAILI